MPENRHLRFLLILLYTALSIIGVMFFTRYFLKWFMPFVIAFIIAAVLNRPTNFFVKKLHLSRSFASVLMVVFIYGIVGTGVGFLLSYIVSQIRAFVSEFPDYLVSLQYGLDHLWDRTLSLIESLPKSISNPVLSFIESNISEYTLPAIDFGSMFGTVKSVAFSIPGVLIFTIALLMSTFYFLKDFDGITSFLWAQFPERVGESMRRLKTHLSSTLGKWFRAMGIIMSVTFGELLAGFLILRLEYAVLIAAIVALIDALPVFGTGTVLIPWSLYLFLMGDYYHAIFIALMYAVITAVRNVIEPRILGNHIGLNPLIMLMCFYLGFMTFGLLGMFVLPFILICLDKLQEWGYIKLWRTPDPPYEPEIHKKPRRFSRLKKTK